MKTIRRHLIIVLAVASLAALAGGAPAEAQQFRVQNKVFLGNQREPQVESTTIFLDGVVYDFLQSPAEVTILDQARSRFVLLYATQRMKTELSTEQLASLSGRLQQWALGQSDPFLRFLAAPSFDRQFDDQTGALTLTSPWADYRMTTVPAENEAVSRQYREFSDWYCRLNTAVNPGSRPPFARLVVNAALDAHQRLPREVVLTLRPPPKPGSSAAGVTIRSEHQWTGELDESDRRRVAQTAQFLTTFDPVRFEQYQAKIAR